MTLRNTSDQALNAYVDGELLPEEAAVIADRVAADAGLARRVAALHELKAGVASFASASPPDVEARPAPSRWSARWGRLRRGGVMAAALGGLALMVWGLAPPQDGAPRPTTRHQTADALLMLHDAWAAEFALADNAAITASAPAWLSELLAANGLQLMMASDRTVSADLPAVHYAFVGPNACKLSLFELPAAPASADTLSLSADGELQTASWQMGAHAYVMVARNMNRARFATIAASVHSATQFRAADQAGLFAAMATSRQRCTV